MTERRTEPIPEEVEAAFNRLDPAVADVLRAVRRLIFETAAAAPEIGLLTETLKWGEPAYLTRQTKSGSTLRLGKTKPDAAPALFVHCQTNLIDQFRMHYPDCFDYQGNRALVLRQPVEQTTRQLSHCIALTLTYHSRKGRKG